MQGQLFTQDFLTRGVLDTPAWQALTPAHDTQFESALRSIYEGLSAESSINEAQTEALVINKVLALAETDGDHLHHPGKPSPSCASKTRRLLATFAAATTSRPCSSYCNQNKQQISL